MTERKQINTHAVTALTLGILSIFIPFIGLILGVLGIIFYRKSIREKESSAGLAIAGLICSIVGITFQLFIVLGLLAFVNITDEIETIVNSIIYYL